MRATSGLILLLVFIEAVPVLAQETLCATVERIYPAELLELDRWHEACRRETDPDALLATLDDPLAQVGELESGLSAVDYYPIQGSTAGMIHLSGFEGQGMLIAAFDAALDQARYDDGLILDLRGASGGSLETAYEVMARLTNANLKGVTVRRRDPETGVVQSSGYQISPRGPWQFDLPVVILVDEGTAWPATALLYAARQRSQIETLGRTTAGTKGVAPTQVTVENEVNVEIPTAAVYLPDGKLLRGQPFEPGVNVDEEQRFNDYRSYPDPLLQRGLDELYRMIGRLEWLQDEYRKQLRQQDSLKRGK